MDDILSNMNKLYIPSPILLSESLQKHQHHEAVFNLSTAARAAR